MIDTVSEPKVVGYLVGPTSPIAVVITSGNLESLAKLNTRVEPIDNSVINWFGVTVP